MKIRLLAPMGLILAALALTAESCATTSGSSPNPVGTASTSPAVAAKTSPTPSAPHFGDGTHQVGKDIQAGTYRTHKGSSGCYWARLKGFTGSLDELLANDNTDAVAVVTILPTDKGFESRSCGTWSTDLSQVTKSQTAFGEGTFIIGTDVLPGTYHSTGGASCYWARLKNFEGGIDSLLANDNTTSPATVTIKATDKGFQARGCGDWSKA